MIGVETLVAVHDRHEVVGVRQVNNIVGVAGEHMDGFDFVAADLELQDFVRADPALLDKAVTGNNDEELPLGVVPVLTFGNARFGDIDTHLADVGTLDKFGERAARVHVHLQRESHLLLRQITYIRRIKCLGERAVGDFGNDERLRLRLELLQERDNLPERGLVGVRHIAVASIHLADSLHAVELAMVLPALQGGNHFVNEVVDIEQFQLHRRVVDLNREIVGDIVAERCHGGVVVRPAPLAEEVGETIDKHICTGLFGILEEQFLASFLTFAVGVSCIAAYQSCLNGA